MEVLTPVPTEIVMSGIAKGILDIDSLYIKTSSGWFSPLKRAKEELSTFAKSEFYAKVEINEKITVNDYANITETGTKSIIRAQTSWISSMIKGGRNNG